MVKKHLYLGLLMGIMVAGCSGNQKETIVEKETLSPCDFVFGGINFSQAKNGGENGVEILDDTLKFVAAAKTDYFRSPDGSVIDTSPVIFTEVDNTKPFTFTAKVEPKFTKSGTYSAGVLYVYEDSTHCQKLCFEQDEYGAHRIVSVRTIGTSDDNNHQSIDGPNVFMRISSDGKQIGSYYSEDGKTWRLARVYRNDYPEKVLLGLSSQSPVDNGHVCQFTDVSIVETAVSDFRNGKLDSE